MTVLAEIYPLVWGVLVFALVFPPLWVAGDFLYSRVTAFRLRRWEAAVRRDPDGVRAGCQEFTIGRGRCALLMIHGFGDTPSLFAKLAKTLAGHGFTCRAMRLPGAGMPLAESARVGHEEWVRAAAAEIEALRPAHESLWVVGHSLGCTLALEHLLAHPDAVDGLVLIAPLIGVSGRRSPVFPARTWFRIAGRFLRFTRVVEVIFPIDGYTKEARTYRLHDRFIPWSTYVGTFEAIGNVEGMAGRVKKPLLMVLAPRDRVIDSRVAARFFEACAAQTKRLDYARHSGHVIPIDGDAPAVADAIRDFIRSVGAGDSAPDPARPE